MLPEPAYAHTRTVVSPRTLELRVLPGGRLPVEVAAALRDARLRAGLTQTALADLTTEAAMKLRTRRSKRRGLQVKGITQQMISYLETSSRRPSVRTARLIVGALGLRPWDPLRRSLLAAASRSTRRSRRVRGAMRRTPALRLATRAAGLAFAAVEGQAMKAEARRQRETGQRRQKGGAPIRRQRRKGVRR